MVVSSSYSLEVVVSGIVDGGRVVSGFAVVVAGWAVCGREVSRFDVVSILL